MKSINELKSMSDDELKKTAPIVHVTRDLGMFARLEGNREVTKKRAEKIAKSIMDIGLVRVPIVVNENFQVIDGQGRIEAAKRLGIPIYYTVEPGLGLEDCIAMNINSTSWIMLDYIQSFANTGNENYQRFLRVMGNHHLPISVVMCAVTGLMSTSNSDIKTGELVFPKERVQDVEEMLSFVDLFVPVCKENNIKGTASIYIALCFCYQCSEVDNRRMYDSFVRYWHKVRNTTSILEMLGCLTDIYNYGRRSNKVYIDTKYREYMDGLYPWYAAKWGNKATEADA